MSLRNVHAFGSVFDLEISRQGDKGLKIILKEDNQPIEVYSFDAGAARVITLRRRR